MLGLGRTSYLADIHNIKKKKKKKNKKEKRKKERGRGKEEEGELGRLNFFVVYAAFSLRF